jgi:hypothetical protein
VYGRLEVSATARKVEGGEGGTLCLSNEMLNSITGTHCRGRPSFLAARSRLRVDVG